MLDGLISGAIDSFIDRDLCDEVVEREEAGREAIREAAAALQE